MSNERAHVLQESSPQKSRILPREGIIVGMTEVRRNNPLNDPDKGRDSFLMKRRKMTGVVSESYAVRCTESNALIADTAFRCADHRRVRSPEAHVS